jgi:nicotinamide-nucleotide adenylyltransferase
VRGLLVGRFQPFHSGHLGLVQGIRHRSPGSDLLIAIGSAEQSYTWENPFTAGERFEMIEAALREAGIDRVSIVMVTDIQRHAIWVRYLEGLLPPFDRVYTNNPLTRLLFEKAGYTVEGPRLIQRSRFEGIRIRNRLADGLSLEDRVPPAVARYLESIGASARLSLLRGPRGPPRSLAGP